MLFWPVPLPPKPFRVLPYTTSHPSAPLFPGPWGFPWTKSCQIRTVSLWWWQTSGRALREEAAKFSLLWFDETWPSPYCNSELSLGGESSTRHLDRTLSSLPQRYPNTQHCSLVEVEITEKLSPDVSSSCIDHRSPTLHEESLCWCAA